jgi:hypothetical protein
MHRFNRARREVNDMDVLALQEMKAEPMSNVAGGSCTSSISNCCLADDGGKNS